ncbi:MAG: LysM peptidoglycan-binding domain-containing protein [Phycisphaeraceae bacterium]|nr:LysM peptidoglycan-binding domain-containing protein [Phycisphaeraceae bacterium]
MTRTFAFALTLVLAGLVGCDKNKDNAINQAPPPDASQDAFAPVEVTPATGSGAGYVDPYAPQPVAPMAGNSYTIKKGDTLWSIAQRHYGNGQKWQDIVSANPGLDPNKLPVGKTIVLP